MTRQKLNYAADGLASDPIKEIEQLGGRIIIHHDPVIDVQQLWWFIDPAAQELISGQSAEVGSIRNAARRLLARVRGAK